MGRVSSLVEYCLLSILIVYSLKVGIVQGQTHQWITTYTPCSKPCGGGIQTLVKECFTVEFEPKPAFKQYCQGLVVIQPLTKACNTQSCELCERTLTTLSGIVTSPYYPEKFTLPRYCAVHIELPEANRRVVLAFSEFSLDGLELEQGLTAEDVCICGTICLLHDPNFDKIREELCGTKPPFVWVSQSNQLDVEFITERHDIFNRFHANYTAITTSASGCTQFIDTEVDGPNGFLTSLNFPNHYENNLHCEYIIQADPVHRLILFVESFQLEPGNPKTNCNTDHLKISDLYTWRNDVYCGTQHSFAWVSDSNGVWLVFHTNHEFVYEGFLIAYEVIDRDYYPLVFTTFPGEFQTPGYPWAYPAFTKFEYLIHAKPSEVVVITFNDFHLEAAHTTEEEEIALCEKLGFVENDTLDTCLEMIENGDLCGRSRSCYIPCTEETAQDFIEILDVYYSEISMYCGYLPTFSWVSKGNEVLLRFYSDENEDFKGFSASYRAIERRPPSEWELVFRAASGRERNAASKWLDESRGYNEGAKAAKSVTVGSLQTYKNRIVNEWENIGVRKVKIELYKSGNVLSAFIFEGIESSNLTDWFECENLIYAPYSNLYNCTDLVFKIDEEGIEIANELGSNGDNCTDADGLVWLDLQDVPDGSYTTCSYENAAATTTRFFYSTLPEGTPTNTGTGMEYADVFTIWIQRDCDQHLIMNPSERSVESEDYGFANYPHFEYCDMYFTTDPLQHITFNFKDFIMQTDCELQRDYVVIEDVTSEYWICFVGNKVMLNGRLQPIMQFLIPEYCSSLLRSSFGNLTNLDYPDSPQYIRPQGCSTLVHAPPADRVVFSFNKFSFDFDIGPEFVIVDNFGNDLLVPLSGHLYPFSCTSASNELALWYYPQPHKIISDIQVKLVKLNKFHLICLLFNLGCLEFYDAEFSGFFDWPLLAMPTGSQNCFTIIRTHPVLNRRVTLTFSNLVLQLLECDAYLQVQDSTTSRNDKYCTTAQVSFTWTSDTNEAIIKFYHGPLPALHQVEAEYRSLQRVDPQWYQVFTEDSGHFWSPNYPNLYPNDIPVAEYLFHANAFQLVLIVFTDFGVEGPDVNGTCRNDYVRLYDLLDQRKDNYCNDQPPFGWCSSGNEALVSLIVDKTAQKRGFYANYAFLPRPDPAACGGLFNSDSGEFSSPNYPRAYGNNQLCVYVFQVSSDKRITLQFDQLVTQPDVKCEKDHLEVQDKITGRKNVYCGTVGVPLTWTSQGNVIVMTFISDLTDSAYSGFTGSYTISDREDTQTCIEEFMAQSGTIKSPRFPSDYYNNANCRYEITVDEGFAIQLTFVEFNLEPVNPTTTSCDFDYVEILDGNDVSQDKLCGSRGPFERRIISNKVTLIFSSDFISFYKGFVVNYEQVSLTTPPPSCDQVFTGTSGVFTSPNYPGNYPDNTECRIEINVADTLRVKITFTDFSLEGYPNCPYDYVKVTDIEEGIMEKYCGRIDGPIEWRSESHNVLVLFHSDDRTPSSGFTAIYETEPIPVGALSLSGCGSGGLVETSAQFGQLISPNYPRPYSLNQNCRVRITLRPEKACLITFTEFALEAHPKCAYDYVELTSFPDGASERFCGTPFVPFTWRSTGNICEVHFNSDAFVPSQGYRGSFEAVEAVGRITVAPTTEAPTASECNQELSHKSGTFTTPNYPAKYPLNAKCSTRIRVPEGFLIQVSFRQFDVEDEPNCNWDYVEIVDNGAGGVKTKRFCGNFQQSFTHTSLSNDIEVKLVSDNYESKTGYFASYKAVSNIVNIG
ncbi:LOW QUALITY PROTEIN: cubilin-like [Amphiura filiformis]|uniref:LOW QUALITY PROTEIN: cubilin-like n=1 Tax=Amphiura filiformis TaxID=82378 RepID=UPI003B2105D0